MTTDPAPAIPRRPRIAAAAWFASLGLVVACGRATLLPEHGHPPPEVQQACHRTELRCSTCHTLDRILSSQPRSRDQWARVVNQMRLRPASGIPIADTDEIVRCLMYVDAIRQRDGGLRWPHAAGTRFARQP